MNVKQIIVETGHLLPKHKGNSCYTSNQHMVHITRVSTNYANISKVKQNNNNNTVMMTGVEAMTTEC